MSCVKCTHETAQLFGRKFFVFSELGGRGGRRQISMALTSRATHIIQWPVQWVAKSRDGANPIKTGLSSDCRLQLACMKSELLVIANQNVAVNAFPGLVHTARHTMEVGGARSWSYNRLPKAKPMTGVKS